jgi:hypothetical protein
LVSEKSFSIVSEDVNHKKFTVKPKCEVQGDGEADSTFAIDRLLAINPIIGKSKNVRLWLGMNQPMSLELIFDEMSIQYHLKQKQPMNALQEKSIAN